MRTRWPVLLAIAHALLALVYGALNPLYEAHDETGHFAYVNHVAAQAALPNALDESNRALLDQSHQPPLYYVLTSLATGWLPRDPNDQPLPNTFAFDGTNRRGTRILLRERDEAFPWSGNALALHAARVVSTALSALMVLVLCKSAQWLFGNAPAAWLSGAIAAFNPQVLFTASMVNNDVMVSLIGALVAYALMRLAKPGGPQSGPRSAWLCLGLGAALGLGVLAKNNSYALIPLAAAALCFVAWRQRWRLRELVARGALVAIPLAVLALPYIAYNCVRYAGRCFIDRNAVNPILSQPASLIGEGIGVALRDAWLPQIFINAFRTSWGTFGWGNVQFPGWVYAAAALFCAAGAFGFLVVLRRSEGRTRDALLILAALGLAVMLLPLYRAIYFQDPALMPGRYLMPALTAYAVVVGSGWGTIVTGLASRAGPGPSSQDAPISPAASPSFLGGLIVAALAALALAVPIAVLRPAYAANVSRPANPPAPLLTYEDALQLLDLSAETVYLPDREGQREYARVRTTWRALRPVPTQLAFGLSVLGRDKEVLGNMTRFPARGNFPSTNWSPGDAWQETFDILLEKPCASLPALGQVNVDVFEAAFTPAAGGFPEVGQGRSLPTGDASGRATTPIVGRFRIGEAPQMAVFWQPALAMFDGIGLRSAALPTRAAPGQTITPTLTYELWQRTSKDAKAFVHALDGAGRLVAQDDRDPGGGGYPTDYWQPGECTTQSFSLNLPVTASGRLRVVTGMYERATGARLHSGTPDHLIEIGTIEVAP